MEKAQEQHLKFILKEFKRLTDPKYRNGQKEHGGDLFLKKGIIDMIIEEAIDQFVYAVTLKEQLKGLDIGEIEE